MVEPFGPWADDLRSARDMALHCNINRDPSKRREPFSFKDFLLGKPGKGVDRKNLKLLRAKMIAAIGKPTSDAH